MTVNVNALDRVVNFLEKNPQRWDQEEWARLDWDHPGGSTDEEELARCGTTGCIAGWTVLLHDGKRPPPGGHWETRAKEILGLTESQAHNIFRLVRINGEPVTWPQMKQRIQEVTGVKL